MEEQKKNKFAEFHDKYYKVLLLIPAILILFSLVHTFIFYSQNGDFFNKDISLTGGTSVTINDASLDVEKLAIDLQGQLEDINTRNIYDLITREQKAVIVETKSNPEITKQVLEDYLGYKLNSENSSFEFTGSVLSENFYKQLLIALLIAFVFMALVVFAIFRTFVPSAAVIISAFADILMTIMAVNLVGMRISTAGIVAFLMLIGYSVDTDILLTNRVLKGGGDSVNKKIFGAFKTGMTMTMTAIIAVLTALFVVISFSSILNQIFIIIAIGLGFDILNTWVTNVSILKWYKENEK